MSYVRKFSFTLIEVMISFSLIAALLVIGLGAYSHITLLEKEGRRLRHIALEQRLAQARLSSLFLRIPAPEPFPGKPSNDPKKPKELPARIFYSNTRFEPGIFLPGSLAFTYDNQTDLWPEFCNDVVARLYIKEGKLGGVSEGLWLATWPRPGCSMDPDLARHEQLLSGVKSMTCLFYEPPQVESPESNKPSGLGQAQGLGQDAAAVPTPQADQWNTTWLLSFAKLPTIVHIHLEMHDQEAVRDQEAVKVNPIDFYFPLINTGRVPILKE